MADFRISYADSYCHINRKGIDVVTDEVLSYLREMVQQLSNAGCYMSESDMIWTEDRYTIFFR